MTLFSLILALAFEQWRPLVERRRVFAPVSAYSSYLERTLNAGEAQQGVIAWLLAVVPVVLGAWALYAALSAVNPLFGLALNVAVLYVTMGFRQESHYFTDIHKALKAGEVDRARGVLAEWRGHACETLSPTEVARLTIESALAASHRHVFGVMFWFAVLPGPAGAVLYRLTIHLARAWGGLPRGTEGVQAYEPARDEGAVSAEPPMGPHTRVLLGEEPETSRFGEFARKAFEVIDWLPVRVTAASFAIVGDFEDAVYCWRTQAARWHDRLVGIVLAAGAGAIGVRLGMPIVCRGTIEDRPELGVGEEADSAFLDSTVGLVWRALVLWLVMFLIIGLAGAVS